MPPCPCTMPFGRPVVPDEYRTHSGWSNGTGSNASGAPGADELAPRERVRRGRLRRQVVDQHGGAQRRDLARCSSRDRGPDVERPAVVDVTVDGEQDHRLDLGEPVGDGPRAEVRRARRPRRAQARRRQERHERAAACSAPAPPPGRPRRTPRSTSAARTAATCRAQFAVGEPPRQAVLALEDHRRGRRRLARALAEGVLGVVERRAGEPLRARHRRPTPRTRSAAGVEPHPEELRQRAPERLQIGRRPLPQRR